MDIKHLSPSNGNYPEAHFGTGQGKEPALLLSLGGTHPNLILHIEEIRVSNMSRHVRSRNAWAQSKFEVSLPGKNSETEFADLARLVRNCHAEDHKKGETSEQRPFDSCCPYIPSTFICDLVELHSPIAPALSKLSPF